MEADVQALRKLGSDEFSIRRPSSSRSAICCLTFLNSGDSSHRSAQSVLPTCREEPAPIASSMSAGEENESAGEPVSEEKLLTLSRVGLWRAMRAVASEVLSKDMRVLADVAEVDAATSSLKEKETVKVLEKEGVGLMDGDENGLSGGGELAEEANDVISRLTVET